MPGSGGEMYLWRAIQVTYGGCEVWKRAVEICQIKVVSHISSFQSDLTLSHLGIKSTTMTLSLSLHTVAMTFPAEHKTLE